MPVEKLVLVALFFCLSASPTAARPGCLDTAPQTAVMQSEAPPERFRRSSECDATSLLVAVPAAFGEIARCDAHPYANLTAASKRTNDRDLSGPATRATNPVLLYYSVDDAVCTPLARALTSILSRRLGSSDFLDSRGNEQILERAGFSAPDPLDDDSYNYVPGLSELYKIDITGDGTPRLVYFRNRQNYDWEMFTSWFVLKPDRVYKSADPDGDFPPTSDVDVSAGAGSSPDVSALDKKFIRLEPSRVSGNGKESGPLAAEKYMLSSSLSAFSHLLVFNNSNVYFISSNIGKTPRGYMGTFALTKLRPDLRLEAVCLLSQYKEF
jgi:hypothetical protein